MLISGCGIAPNDSPKKAELEQSRTNEEQSFAVIAVNDTDDAGAELEVGISPETQQNASDVTTSTVSAPMSIERDTRWSDTWGQSVSEVKVVALRDGLIVTNVVLNRGNCVSHLMTQVNGSMQFGDTIAVMYDEQTCTLLEATVSSNFGTFTRTF